MIKEDGTDSSAIAGKDLRLGVQKRIEDFSPDREFNTHPCFDLDCPNEFNSFSRGIKTFKRWMQHTKSEKIRNWANNNPGKSFYVTHNETYTFINRNKK